MPDPRDQRTAPRYGTRIFGVFQRDLDLDETEMLMTNLSLGGAYVRTDNPAPPGTPVTLRFYLPGSETPVPVAGEVVWWRRPGGGEAPGMGVRFMQVLSADLENVKTYLAGLIEESLFG